MPAALKNKGDRLVVHKLKKSTRGGSLPIKWVAMHSLRRYRGRAVLADFRTVPRQATATTRPVADLAIGRHPWAAGAMFRTRSHAETDWQGNGEEKRSDGPEASFGGHHNKRQRQHHPAAGDDRPRAGAAQPGRVNTRRPATDDRRGFTLSTSPAPHRRSREHRPNVPRPASFPSSRTALRSSGSR